MTEADSARMLCRIDDIADPGAKGFEIEGRAPLFVVRHRDRLFGYVNICPHMRTTLDWKPDAFLNFEKTLILCATHGALFRIEDGYCVAGPCPGRSLAPVALRVEDGKVILVG